MVNLFFNYLLQSSICLILFIATYRLLISNLTHFSWMRFYLLVSLALSLVLPLIVIPVQWHSDLISTESFTNAFLLPIKHVETMAGNNSQINLPQTVYGFSTQILLLYSVFTVYLIGFIFKAHSFSKNLKNIFDFIKKNPGVKEGNYWIVCVKSEIPAFSFLNYIFINSNYKNLSTNELQIIKDHEIVHVKQYHTLDILFVEIVGIIFWFNPLMNYLRRSLQEVHEHIVDERIAGHGENKKTYAQLLLNLASETKVFDITASFTGEHIKRRILMIAKPRTAPKFKLMFIVLVPITAILLLSFSCIKDPDRKSDPKIQTEVTGSKLKSGKINGTDRSKWTVQMELQKYCGVYVPSKKNSIKPMDIVLMDYKLFKFVETESDPYNRTIELKFEAGNKFSYGYRSSFSIEFILNSKNEVTGCLFTQREGLNFVTHEFLKQNC